MFVRNLNLEQIVRMGHDRKILIKDAVVVGAVIVHKMIEDFMFSRRTSKSQFY